MNSRACVPQNGNKTVSKMQDLAAYYKDKDFNYSRRDVEETSRLHFTGLTQMHIHYSVTAGRFPTH